MPDKNIRSLKIFIGLGCAAPLILLLMLFGLLAIGFYRADQKAQEGRKFAAEYDPIYASTTERAVVTKNPLLCTGLITHRYFHSADWDCDGCYSRQYRDECLLKYIEQNPTRSVCDLFSDPMTVKEGYFTDYKKSCPTKLMQIMFKQTHDPKYCFELRELDTISADQCFEYLAEIKKDDSWCDKLEDPDGFNKILCRAIAKGDANLCYQHSKGNSYCLKQVVLRTRDYHPCLQIDGPDYGSDWKHDRNDCLMRAAFFAKQAGKDTRPFCHLMATEDQKDIEEQKALNDGLSFSFINQEVGWCYKNFITDYSFILPPRLPW